MTSKLKPKFDMQRLRVVSRSWRDIHVEGLGLECGDFLVTTVRDQFLRKNLSAVILSPEAPNSKPAQTPRKKTLSI